MAQMDAEAIVVGGGLVGLAAALAVSKAGLSTIHLAPRAPADRRTSALMMPSVEYLRSANIIGSPEQYGHALKRIRIIDATSRLLRAPESLFDASEIGLEAFGWNFPNARLLEALQSAKGSDSLLAARTSMLTAFEIDDKGPLLTLDNGQQLRAPLVVGADGKKSLIRSSAGFRAKESSFTQAALVCDLELRRELGSTSVEFHYPNGPFTLVPAGGRNANLVWIDDQRTLKEIQAAGKERLAAAFAEKSQRLFGAVSLSSPAYVFPLSTMSVDKAGARGVVLVGEAAHAFPPIGAQGLNLGLRDIADLEAALAVGNRNNGWADRISQDYSARRSSDLARTGGMVDALFRSLLTEMLPAQALRAGGLWALKLAPRLRRHAFAVGMGR